MSKRQNAFVGVLGNPSFSTDAGKVALDIRTKRRSAMKTNMTYSSRNHDALFMPMNFSNHFLMLQYRIQLVRCEPTSHFNILGTYCTGNGILHDGSQRFHLDAWTDAEWNGFSNNFTSIITRYWDEKFELTPNRPWYPNPSPQPPSASAITCNLSLELVDSAAQAHHRYFIVKPQESDFRSFASSPYRLGMFTHRDLTYDWNTRRTQVGPADRRGRRKMHSVSFLQCTVLHEFGHTLGLDHVNGAGNDDWNYGVSLDQREDLMGMGDHLTGREAFPWKSQLRHHLIPEAADHKPHVPALKFTARVTAPQLITYWDNDWTPAPAPATP